MTDSFMSNVLGGGIGSFRHLVEHIGVSSKIWTDDMKAHEFDNCPESIDRVATSVEETMNKRSVAEVTRVRDKLTVALLKQKREEEGS